MVFKYRENLQERGYLIFVSENGYQIPSTVSVIKSNDQFDILRIQKTDGINYNIENKDVISKLKEQDLKYKGIKILGADYDWVDFMI